ncbi:hypothetical protein LCGC14_0972790 [marine sediment metagenome]|uniref:Uncharacterized protein n=1 Tax=marine sediment metagenome TaxID=412755 RepID=A0A0F9NX95_9ZZZZ
MEHTKENWQVANSGGSVIIGGMKHPTVIAVLETQPLKITPEIEHRAKLIAAAPDLLAAVQHGAMSNHHPACSHGKRGDGNTCECHVKKCQDAIAKAKT